MRRITTALALLPIVLCSPALSATVSDPTGDFLSSFVGIASPDLDVTSFSVALDPSATNFTLGAVLAGPINPALAGFYVIGVDTGAGAIRPFGAIGEPNVIFDRVIVVQKNGSATLGSNSLGVSIVGNQFIVTVPTALLPSTGATPANYGFNIWPRYGATVTNNSQISDFAPNNALLSVSGFIGAVPEPSSWLTMLLGFGLIGASLRFRRDPRATVATAG